MPNPTRRDWLSILFLGLIWGGTFMVQAIALRGYGPLTVSTARVALGAAALTVLALALRRPLPKMTRALWAHIVPIGILSSALPFFLLSWGQQTVPSAFAGLAMSALPIFVLPLAYFFAGEPLFRNKIIGFGIGFVGTLILMGPEVATGGVAALPRLACIAASFSYAVSSILTRRCPPIDPMVLGAMSLLVGAAILIPAMLLVEGVPEWIGGISGNAIIVLGLIPTALAALLRVMVIRSAGSGFMTLTNYQVPLWSMLFGVLVLDETLPLRFFAALALILTGLLISQRRPA